GTRTPSGGTTSTSYGAMSPTLPGQLNLDLSSTLRTLSAPAQLAGQTVTIRTGSTNMLVDGQTTLTPAERVAVWQVLKTKTQSIQLGQLGNAIGGQLVLGSWLNKTISNLVIPSSVTTIDQSTSINIASVLVNSGALNVQSTTGASATISA